MSWINVNTNDQGRVTMTRKIPDIGVSSAVISMMTNDAATAIRYSEVISTAALDLLLLPWFIVNSVTILKIVVFSVVMILKIIASIYN